MVRYVFVVAMLLASCKTTSLYVVRHAEKEGAATDMMTTDAPLSAEGSERALALRDQLKGAGIQTIYSTATNRTTATARPLSAATNVAIQLYDAQNPLFVKQLVRHRGAPVLIVGHSNTVDDIVNTLTGKNLLQDLPDNQYGDLFIVRLRGKKAELERSRYGK